MVRVGRVHPPKNQVLRDISLGFFYGAKIGVLGLNGSARAHCCASWRASTTTTKGRSPPPRVTPRASWSRSRTWTRPRPSSRSSRRRSSDRRHAGPLRPGLRRFAEPDADFDALIEEQGKLQEQLDHVEADPRLRLDTPWAPSTAPGDTPVKVLSGGERRRVALTRLLLTEPDILPARRAHQPPDTESVAWLERICATTRHGHRRHARPLLPRQTSPAGSSSSTEATYPLGGQLHLLLEQKAERLRLERSPSRTAAHAQRELEWIRMSPKARQAKGQARVTPTRAS